MRLLSPGLFCCALSAIIQANVAPIVPRDAEQKPGALTGVWEMSPIVTIETPALDGTGNLLKGYQQANGGRS